MANHTKLNVNIKDINYSITNEEGRTIIKDINDLDITRRIVSCFNACIPFQSPQEDIPKLVGIYKLMLERMCESCQIHNPQHAPSGDYKGCTSCEEIEAYRDVLALYQEGK